jgi:flagellum-specific ATP synthase
VSDKLVGRVLNALGKPMDDGPAITEEIYYPVDNAPPNPLTRTRIVNEFPLGIRAIDGLLTVGQGQRLGIFAGSGVGKSTLLGMIARNAVADINVIILVGERGREVKDFLEKDLGAEGLQKSVLIIATSDQPALLRLKAALVGTSIAGVFQRSRQKVLMLMDSVTRFAMAQREIGMAVGEPPISRGSRPPFIRSSRSFWSAPAHRIRGRSRALHCARRRRRYERAHIRYGARHTGRPYRPLPGPGNKQSLSGD